MKAPRDILFLSLLYEPKAQLGQQLAHAQTFDRGVRMMYIIKEKERMYWKFRAKSINACADKLGFARKNFASPVSRSTDDRSQSC